MMRHHALAVPKWYRPPVTARDIIERAADLTGIPASDITGPRRHAAICRVRWAVMAALRDKGLSLPQVGARLGRRDHTTIMHGLARAEAMARDDFGFRKLVRELGA